jgi:hypothetical protein
VRLSPRPDRLSRIIITSLIWTPSALDSQPPSSQGGQCLAVDSFPLSVAFIKTVVNAGDAHCCSMS